ncbi:MAG: cytochrome-c peroxidase [Deltaproteobacteria bacterium]|nr:cytochrome-c peroxidase [Deltaproteobacteria bacterium]
MRRLTLAALLLAAACRPAALRAPEPPPAPPAWEAENPVRPLPRPPLGSGADFARVPWVTPEKARLGRWLFHDPRLSADGTISCATCHEPQAAFSEERPVSTGIRGQVGRRKAPPILNAAWPLQPVFFWDGRARSLAEQAKGPIENPIEMGNTHEGAVRTVAAIAGYRPYFRQAFGDDGVDIDRIAEAIAAYEATRLSGDSAYDRFDAGDEKALSEEAIQGRDLFFGRAKCSACHLGPSFTDARFHNLGVGWKAPPPGRPAAEGFADRGRWEVTRAEKDLGAFKTPTLRNLARRAPYMHDGSMKTLREVVVFYMRGGEENPWLAQDARDADFMPCEVSALVAFLESLEGTGHEDRAPALFPR